jgi:hypothetical protein
MKTSILALAFVITIASLFAAKPLQALATAITLCAIASVAGKGEK